MILRLHRRRSTSGTTIKKDRKRSTQLLTAASWIGVAGLVLFLVFISGGLAYKSGLRPSTVQLFVQEEFSRLTSSRPSLPTFSIDMGFENLEKIRAKREEALSRGFLFSDDDDFVSASINFNGEDFPVKIRLKGDLRDHWETDKWSFRIHTRGDSRLQGMKRFSIQSAHTRTFHFEQGFLEHLKYEGILAPRTQFINVEFNGEVLGIYLMDEFMSKEMIEASGRRQGVIMSLDETKYMDYLGAGLDINSRSIVPFGYLGTHAGLRIFQEDQTSRDPILSAQAQTATEMFRGFQEGRLLASDIFDVNLTARYLAIIDLWKADHATHSGNIRWYYNPITAKLEPVGFDAVPDTNDLGETILVAQGWFMDHILGMLADPVMVEALVQELERVSTPKYLAQLRKAIGDSNDQSRKALSTEYFGLQAPWALLERRQALTRNILDPPVVAVAYARTQQKPAAVNDATHNSQLVLDISNLLTLPLEVIGLRIQSARPNTDNALPRQPGITIPSPFDSGNIILSRRVRGAQNGYIYIPDEPLKFKPIQIDLTSQSAEVVANGGNIYLQARILGQDLVREIPVTMLDRSVPNGQPLPVALELEEFLEIHSFISHDTQENALKVQPGTWKVDGDLVVPPGLSLEAGPGTVFIFEKDSILMTSGPLRFIGSEDAPVELEGDSGSWGGILVNNSNRTSVWDNVVVRDTAGISTPGLSITGGVTFYASPLSFQQVKFIGTSAEDSLNAVFSSITLDNVEFSQTVSDAFDGDSVSGTITNSHFSQIGGDAIDLSASQIDGRMINFRNIGDKAVSVGESTTATFSHLDISRVGIGIASKDSSSVEIADVSISEASYVGLASYQKKPEYGPSKLIATEVEITNTPQALLAQTNSYILVDSKKSITSDVDIEALYKAGIMGN